MHPTSIASRIPIPLALALAAALLPGCDDTAPSSSNCDAHEVLVDGRCQTPCSRQQPCGAGLYCGAGGFCMPGCLTTGCGDGQVCDEKSLQCRVACAGDADCSGDTPECLTSAEKPFCVACVDPGHEPNEKPAEALALGAEPVSGERLCAGDADWFAYTAPEALEKGGVLTLRVEQEGPLSQIRLTVLDADGATTLLDRAPDAAGRPAQVQLLGRGPYFIGLTAQGGQPRYRLGLEASVACRPDALEPNDSAAKAAALGEKLGQRVEGLTLCGSDEDWYRFEVEAGKVISAELAALSSHDALRVALYRQLPDGTVSFRAGGAAGASDQSVSYPAQEGGTYLLSVSRDGDGPGVYSLQVALGGLACAADALEPNDRPDLATRLEDDGSGDLTPGAGFEKLTLCDRDEDWFELSLVNGQVLRADATFEQGDLALTLFQVDSQGVPVQVAAADSLTQEEHLAWRAQATATYQLRVSHGRDASAAAYRLEVSTVGKGCLPDAFEPNDYASEARTLTPDDSGNLTASGFEALTNCFGDEDWYQAELKAGQLLSVDLSFEEGDLGLQLFYRMPDGTLAYLAHSDGVSQHEHAEARAARDGLHLIQVMRLRGTQAVPSYAMSARIVGAACAPDAFEPNDLWSTATRLTDDGSGNYTKAGFDRLTVCYGDSDWYSLELKNGQVLDLDVTATPGADLAIGLGYLAADGSFVPVLTSDSATSSDHLTHVAVWDGTYVVQVFRGRSTVSAEYALSVRTGGKACVADSFEPNDNRVQAKALQDDGTGNFTAAPAFGKLTTCYGDEDWFQFQLGNGQQAALDLSFAAGDLGVWVYLAMPDGSLFAVASSDAAGTTAERAQWVAPASGTYFAQVYRSRGTVAAAYQLSLKATGAACSADAKEANNDAGSATALSDSGDGNWTASGFDALSLCAADEDWFALTLGNGQLVTAEVAFSSGDLGLYLYYRQADGSLSGVAMSDGAGQTERIAYRALSAGTHYLRVYRSRGATTAGYSLSVKTSGAACAADSFEPNDSPPQAKALSDAGGGDYTKSGFGSLTLCYGDEDWFSLSLKNGQRMAVEAAPQSGDLSLMVYRLDSYGVLTAVNGSDYAGTGPEVLSTPVQFAGTYFVRVALSRATPSATYALSVKVDLPACAPDANEPNDSWVDATPLDLAAGPVKLTGVTQCYGDDDWYAFSLENSQTFDASLLFDEAAVDLSLFVYRLDGAGVLQYVTSSDGLGDEAVNFVGQFDGDYFLRVQRSRGAVAGTYELNAKVIGTACEPDAMEPNDHALFAKALTLNPKGGAALVVDDLTVCYGDLDYYSFGANPGDPVSVQLNPIYDGDLALYVYELLATGTLAFVGASDTVGGPEAVSFTVPGTSGGKYVAYVFRSNGASRAKYQLQIKR